MTTARKPPSRGGFTLLEVLIVIGIIVLLVSILLPVASSVRLRAQVTQTQAQMAKLQQAIMNYYHDWNAYPGPLANDQLANEPRAGQTNIAGLTSVTSSENLALGLLGYLDAHYSPAGLPTLSLDPVTNQFPPRPPKHDVVNLNPLQPKSYHYIDFISTEVSNGPWGMALGGSPALDNSGTNPPPPANDSQVPEFLDQINAGIGPMPILYVRANTGAPGVWYPGGNPPSGQYDILQFKPYGFTTPDSNDFAPAPGMNPQSPWTAYLGNRNLVNTARGKDGFILISAGADRKYGTADDLIVTP